MKYLQSFKKLITLTFTTWFFLPILTWAQEEGGGNILPPPPDGGHYNYGFDDLIALFNNVISFLVFYIAVPVAVIAITIAGIWMVIYASNDSQRGTAKAILWAAVLGLVLALAGFLIIQAIVMGLTKETGDLWEAFRELISR